MGCDHNCGSCGGCGALELTELELELLRLLGQLAFLPVARKPEGDYPVCRELEGRDPEQTGLALVCLEKRGLVDLDYCAPLKGMDMAAYAGYSVHGSAGLTVRGQQAVEYMEIQGVL
jgi:hypothetical protein